MLGKRLDVKAIAVLMQRWEFMEKRGALLDSISTLRQVVQSTTTDADLEHVLLHLFLQQRSGIRSSLVCNTKNEANAGNVVKALIVRRNLFVHLKMTFPKCTDAIEPYESFQYYTDNKGVDMNGVRTSTADMDDEEGDETAETSEAPSSVQQSRKQLIKLCEGLAANRHERTLVKMGKEHLSSNTVDLTTPSAKPILTAIQDIKSHYTTDFAAAVVAPHVVVHATASHEEVRVQVEADDLDENSYKDKLRIWEQDVQKYEESQCNTYLKQHVLGYVVDPMDDPSRAAIKVERLCNACGVGKGVKRKLFMHNDLDDKAVDWDKYRKGKRSVFTGTVSKLDRTDLDPLMEIYDRNKAPDDSEDVVAVVTSGPPSNAPTDRNVIVAHARLKALQPQHQKPKIGTIEIARNDILQRTRTKKAFVGQNEHRIIFTTQSKKTQQRKSFSVLHGDSYFNKSTYL